MKYFKVEETNCDLCGSLDYQAFFERIDRFSGNAFRFVTCNHCGLIYLNPRPTQAEIVEYYPPIYEPYRLPQKDLDPISQWHYNNALLIQIKFIKKFLKPQKLQLLDVGCATGAFLEAAQQHGWEVQGLELVDSAAQIAREHYGLNVSTGTLESVFLPDRSFDVITLWDVLEHLPSPQASLKHCHQLLKEDGLVVFSIPNILSFDRYLFGQNWIGWDAPRHFYMFSPLNVQRLLQQSGFQLISQACILGGKGTFLLSLDSIIADLPFSKQIKHTYPILSSLLWSYRQISYRLKRGPIITIVGKKVIN